MNEKPEVTTGTTDQVGKPGEFRIEKLDRGPRFWRKARPTTPPAGWTPEEWRALTAALALGPREGRKALERVGAALRVRQSFDQRIQNGKATKVRR